MRHRQLHPGLEIRLRSSSSLLQRWRCACARLAVPVVLAVSVAACDDGDYPRGWNALRAPATADAIFGDSVGPRTCPDLAGRYYLNDQVIYAHVIQQLLEGEARTMNWSEATISTLTPDSIQIVVSLNELRDTVRVDLRDRFQCGRGWLSSDWPEVLLQDEKAEGFDKKRGYMRKLWVARDMSGRLIGREERTSYRAYYLWCGDGCRALGLPFTRREDVVWRRMSSQTTIEDDIQAAMTAEADKARNAQEDSIPTPKTRECRPGRIVVGPPSTSGCRKRPPGTS